MSLDKFFVSRKRFDALEDDLDLASTELWRAEDEKNALKKENNELDRSLCAAIKANESNCAEIIRLAGLNGFYLARFTPVLLIIGIAIGYWLR